MSTASQAAKPTNSQTANPDLQFTSVAQAATFVSQNAGIEAPVPGGLPAGAQLSKQGVDISTVEGKTSAQIHLELPGRRSLVLEYGSAGFDGCGPLHPTEVQIGKYPGVLEVDRSGARPYSTVVWPATRQHLQGQFGVSGEMAPAEALKFARSMARTSANGGPGNRPGC